MSMPDSEAEQDQPKQDPHRTCLSRVTLAQELRLFLPPAPFRRSVQIIIPSGKRVFIDEDRPTELNTDGTAPRGLPGRNRNYKLPPFEANQTVEFDLFPGQWLVGCVDEGMVHLAVVVTPVG